MISRARLVPTPLVRPVDRAGVDSIIAALRAGEWSPGSRFVKREGDRWVWLGELPASAGGAVLVIKGRPRGGLGMLPDRHAVKQAIGAARLRRIGVATSEPIALLDVRLESGAAERWLILNALPGDTLANTLARGGRTHAQDAALAQRAGALVRTLHEAGLFNRDHKASNLIVTPAGAIGVVDTVAIRRRRSVSTRRRMLVSMCKELTGIGALPRRTQLLRCLRAASDDARADWRAIALLMRDAGDTTPRVDPLPEA